MFPYDIWNRRTYSKTSNLPSRCNILSRIELKGGVAVVTGEASGIGFALVEQFAGNSTRVVLADIEERELNLAARKVQNAGATVLVHACDVSDESSVEALAEAAYARFGAVHVLCNNAGVGGACLPLWMQTPVI